MWIFVWGSALVAISALVVVNEISALIHQRRLSKTTHFPPPDAEGSVWSMVRGKLR